MGMAADLRGSGCCQWRCFRLGAYHDSSAALTQEHVWHHRVSANTRSDHVTRHVTLCVCSSLAQIDQEDVGLLKSQTPLSFDLNHRSYLRSPVHHPGALLFPCFLHFLVYLAPGCRSLCLLLSHISVFCFVLLFLVKGQNFKMKSPVCLNTVELINKSHLLKYLRCSWRVAQVWMSLNS